MFKHYVTVAVVNEKSFYNQELINGLIGVLLGFVLSLVTTFCANKRNDKKEQIEVRRNTLILITQNHTELFNLIYLGANHSEILDYIRLREELQKSNIIYLLPLDIKMEFESLYSIFFNCPDKFKRDKNMVPNILKNITIKLNEYGVDVFGYK